MGVEIASFLVQQQLLKVDRVIIRLKTIKKVAEEMAKNSIPIDSESLYLNCIVDGLPNLIEYDKQLNTSCKV